MIAALRGGSGKTILSIGLIAAWKKRNRSIAPFKKGPDYIDTGWLALAANRPCYNLDTFLLETPQILQSFLTHTRAEDVAVIEGNRGLYDGIDLAGSTSTAELAKLLKTPVLLCVDCTKITRTMAAVIEGLVQFDPEVMIKGVVLNRVAGARHESILRDNIEHYCGIPVLGAIPKLKYQIFPERHMGLVPTPEHDWAAESIDMAAQVASDYIDLDAVYECIRGLPPLEATEVRRQRTEIRSQIVDDEAEKPRIGIIKDSAFQFYYPENIDALEVAGAETVFISPLAQKKLPALDALYIGGGFPETHAQQLAENISFRKAIKAMAEDGLPIYAECGGLMYLGQELVLEENSYPMVGVFPLTFDFYSRPQGHGYTVVTVENENPFYDIGTEIRGHEFHYSRVLKWSGAEEDLVFRMQRGVGITKNKDGICYKNVLATYTHIHALGVPQWAQALVRNAIAYQHKKAQ
ncbi:MAG: hydrogenobyrinic acid a,c-diamide synthase (glutamine-hydrolyzing) [Deltaproteobacteria bacterium]|nr:hydrogenobyrinic acid a,c-diamide synthase (glutamine-hydrolyzing) [Deltaproteobacteria bacterium]